MDSIACSADLSWPNAQQSMGLNDFSGSVEPGANNTSTGSMERTRRNSGPGIVPLRLAHLCRGLTLPDVNGCCFELHSPDGRRSCLLRAPDPQEARTWFDALHARMKALNGAYLAELNGLLPPTQVNICFHPLCSSRTEMFKTILRTQTFTVAVDFSLSRYSLCSCSH